MSIVSVDRARGRCRGVWAFIENTGGGIMMSYEKLDVYQCAIEFLGISVKIVDEMPKGLLCTKRAQLINQP